MLKAYDYAEPGRQKQEIQNAGLFQKEKGIALKFVLNHVNHAKKGQCPICGSQKTGYIFQDGI